MALSGDFKKQIKTLSETETITSTYTYPQQISSDHPDYNKRGTTEEIVEPLEIISEEILADVYLIVTGTTIEKHINGWTLGFGYRVYNSPEDKLNINPTDDNHLYSYTESFSLESPIFPSNPIESAYEYLKTLPECNGMNNA